MSAVPGYMIRKSCPHDAWAEVYDQQPNPLLALAERTLTPLLPDLRGRAVLDVACGTGRGLERMMALGAGTAVGVDRSAAMLARARSRLAGRARLVRADVLRLPLAAHWAECILCCLALAYLPDVPALARELSRQSRPGAYILIADVHPEAGWRRGFTSPDGHWTEVPHYPQPPRRLEAAFTAAGCQLLSCQQARLGEPERPIFAAAGRPDLFDAAGAVPALLTFVWRVSPPVQP